MDNITPTILKLIRQLQQVPYLASKNLYKVVQHFLDMDIQKTEHFCSLLLDVKNNINKCNICWSWKEKQSDCTICFSLKRDKSIICVVESWQDLIAIEKTGGYQGMYHVLGGILSPLDGVGPEDLTIKSLVGRVKDNGNINSPKEIVLAFNQTPEGEATAAYIGHRLKDTNVKISCLARGLPVGSAIDGMDRLTIFKALSERRPF